MQLTALTAAARLDPGRYRADVRRCVDALNDQYWSDANGIGGYDDGPHPKPPDRYYDDNAWIALGLVEAYEVTHEQRDLDRAAATLRYVLSGEDDKLGGGLYWQERTKASKNTCGNAPGIAAAVRVYTYTHDRSQLDTAVRLYRWTVKNLRDDRDGLYYDNLSLTGKLSPHKFTYNTALMIRSGCLLYDATGDAAYLHDAQRSAASSVKRGSTRPPARSPTRPTSPTCWPSRCWNCRPATTTRSGRPPTTPPWPTSGRPSGTRPGSSPNGGAGRSPGRCGWPG